MSIKHIFFGNMQKNDNCTLGIIVLRNFPISKQPAKMIAGRLFPEKP